MKENTLAPTRPTDGQVTIKAVAADTKTLLDGTAVVWEDNDAIKVVFNGEETHTSVFTTTLSENASSAIFVGTLTPEITVDACGDAGYAIYPSTVNVESDGRIKFAVTDTQNGQFETGENLSYAAVSLTDIKETHSTTASFANALSLIKVTVPAGVKSVTVESCGTEPTPLAGTAPFYYNEGKLEINTEKWGDTELVPDPESTPEVPKPSITVQLKKYALVLANTDDSDLAAGDYWLHVFPGQHESLKVTVEGTDCSYEKVIDQAYEFVASKYHTLNVTSIFSLGAESFSASPVGGTVEIPVTTTVEDYEVVVTFPDGVDEWLTYAPTKAALREDILVFSAEENTSASARTATVTLKNAEKTFAQTTVSQKNYVQKLLGTYMETYVKGYGQPTETGSFEIKMTDDAAQGVYLIDGILGGQKVYADYSDGILTCYDVTSSGIKSRNLTVASDFSQLSASSFQIGAVSIGGYGGSYTAMKSLGAPTLTAEEEAITGMYNETWSVSVNSGTPEAVSSPMGMTIAASDEAALGRLSVKFLTANGSITCYAELSGNTLTVKSAGVSHAAYGDAEKDITMTVSEGQLSFSSLGFITRAHDHNEVTSYTATKPEASDDKVTAEDLLGTWHESFKVGGSSYSSDEMTISETDDQSKGQLKVKMFTYTSSWSGSCSLECYADLSDDGNILTVKSDGVQYGNGGSIFGNMEMIVTGGGSTITFSDVLMVGDATLGMPIGPLTATKL